MSRSHAPSVSYPVGRSRFLGWCLLSWLLFAAGLLTLAALHAWGRSSPDVGLRWAGLLGVTSAVSAGLCWRWWHTPTGWLTWAPVAAVPTHARDSANELATGWWWTPANGAATVGIGLPVITLDGQVCLGLRVPCQSPGVRRTAFAFLAPSQYRSRWLWVDRSMHPERWLALRRALWAVRPA